MNKTKQAVQSQTNPSDQVSINQDQNDLQPQSANPQKSPLTYLLIFFLLLCAGALSFWFYGEKINKKSQLLPSSSVEPISSLTPTSTIPTDWKTYKDEKNSIEFKYPKDWYAKPLSNWSFNIFLENQPFEIPQETEFMTSIQVSLNEVMDATTNQKYFQEKTLEGGVKRIKVNYDQNSLEVNDLIIGGRKAVQIAGILGPGMFEGQYFIETLVQLNDKLLQISLTNKEFKDIYNQILSTFRFE